MNSVKTYIDNEVTRYEKNIKLLNIKPIIKPSYADFIYIYWLENKPPVFKNKTFVNGILEKIEHDETQGFNREILKTYMGFY